MKPPFEAYSGDDAFVFVCYSHEDSEQVYPELVWLKELGLNIWYDEGIAPGEEWPDRIAWAIENAEKVLFYVSPDSTHSRVCRDEIRLASTEGKQIVTVQLEPTELEGGLRLTLGSSQAIVKDHYHSLEDYRSQLSSILLNSGTINLTSKPRHSGSRAITALVVLLVAAVLIVSYYQFAIRDTGDQVELSPEPEYLQSSIAVLPLADMTADRNLDYLGEGLAEELIHGLAQVSGINVVARTSSFNFKNKELDVQSIGELLGVSTVLEGSIRREEDRLRVTLQLIDVENGFHIWSKQYGGLMGDIFTMQDEIARNVVSAVMPDADFEAYGELMNAGTDNPLAYEAFLIGTYERTQQTRDSVERAIEQFQLAISRDPGFSRAYESLIDAYYFRGVYYGEREEMMALAGQVLEQARINVPDRSGPEWFWAEHLIMNGEEIAIHFREAEELYRLMINDRSHVANHGSSVQGFYQYGLLLAKSGLFDTALEFMLPLEAIDPMSINIKLRLAEILAAVGDYEGALEKYEDLLRLSPRYVQAELDMLLLYGKLGRLEEAESVRNRLAEVFSPDLTQFLGAFLMYWRGNREEAIANLDSLRESREIPPNYMGVAYLTLAEYEQAFAYFQAAADQGDPYVSELILTQSRVLPEEQWAGIRDSDAFRSLMSRYDYDDSWPAELQGRANTITDYSNVYVKN